MSRRLFLGASSALVLALVTGGCANTPSSPPAAPPILFVHGNGDSAALWQTTQWRFESNGWPKDRLFALQHPYPLARDDDSKEQAGRSSTAEHMAFLKTQVDKVLAQTGAQQVVLVGNSRGGNAIRNYILNGGGDKTVSHAVLGGTPNHGVWAIPGFREGNEFSGTGPFLKGLNAPRNAAGDEVTGPVKWLTLRSDNNDKFSQPDGEWIGAKGKPTFVGFDNPALKGATNLVLPRVDHRETSYSPQAFEATYRFITGLSPASTTIQAEPQVVLDGNVTGMGVRSEDSASGNFTNNLAIPNARVQVFAVDPQTGLRKGSAVHDKTVGADGRWGPFKGTSTAHYEFEVSAPGYASTHIYRSPFPRSSDLVHLKPERIAQADQTAASIIQLVRPRGYLDPTSRRIALDGQSPPPGVPMAPVAGFAVSKIKLDKPENRAIGAEFHGPTLERLVGRTWSAKENRVVLLEITE
jgi:triacylglycerol lipase